MFEYLYNVIAMCGVLIDEQIINNTLTMVSITACDADFDHEVRNAYANVAFFMGMDDGVCMSECPLRTYA